MDTAELDRQLAEVLEKGFDESFAAFCARTFSSYSYPPENLAAARMHAFFLRLYMEAFVSGKDLLSEGDLEIRCREVGDSLLGHVASPEEFCRRFVEKWCAHCSEKVDSL